MEDADCDSTVKTRLSRVPNRTHWGWVAIVSSVSIATFMLIAFFVDKALLFHAFKHADPVLLALAVGVFITYQALRALRVMVAATVQYHSPISPALLPGLTAAISAQGLAANILPAGLGEMALVALVRKILAERWVASFATVLLLRLCDMGVLAAAIVVALALASNPEAEWFWIAGLGLFGLALVLLGLFVFAGTLSNVVANNTSSNLLARAAEVLSSLQTTLRQYGNGRALAKIIGLTIAIWTTNFFSGLALISALKLQLTTTDYLWVDLLTFPVDLFPLKTIADIGTFEANWVVVLSLLGKSPQIALLMAATAHVGFLAVMILTVIASSLIVIISKFIKYLLHKRRASVTGGT